MCGFISHSGKGESNIDKMTHSDFESTDGNIACNSYKKLKEDVRILKETHVSDLNINLHQGMKLSFLYFRIYMNKYSSIITVIF